VSFYFTIHIIVLCIIAATFITVQAAVYAEVLVWVSILNRNIRTAGRRYDWITTAQGESGNLLREEMKNKETTGREELIDEAIIRN